MLRQCIWMVLLGWGLSVGAVDSGVPLGDKHAERRYVDTLMTGVASFEKSEAEGRPLWRGFMPTRVPTLFVFGSGGLYATKMQAPGPGWQSFEGGQSHIAFQAFDQQPEKVLPLKYVAMTQIYDQEFFVFHVNPKNFEKSAIEKSLYNVVKKEFQAYLENKLPALKGIVPLPNASQIRANRIAMEKLSHQKLAEYLRTANTDALKDYIVLYEEQWRILKEDERKLQNALLLKEGLSHYIALKADDYFFHSEDLAKVVLADLQRPVPDSQLVTWMLEGRYKPLGGALAYVLDSLGGSAWQSHIDSIPLGLLLNSYISMPAEERRDRIHQLMETPTFESLLVECRKAIVKGEDNTDKAFLDFLQTPQLRITLSGEMLLIPVGESDENYYTLGIGPQLKNNFLGVIQNTDQSIWIELNQTPVLMNPNDSFVFYVEDGFNLSVNEHENVPVTGDALWIRPFEELFWDTERSHGRIKAKGQIISGKNGLEINFLAPMAPH